MEKMQDRGDMVLRETREFVLFCFFLNFIFPEYENLITLQRNFFLLYWYISDSWQKFGRFMIY